eukprot:3176302-Pyramimonas_sp.AAC.1
MSDDLGKVDAHASSATKAVLPRKNVLSSALPPDMRRRARRRNRMRPCSAICRARATSIALCSSSGVASLSSRSPSPAA